MDKLTRQSKYTQSRAEANNAHNTLQKEITTLRDSNRTLQLKLRDTEVQNDDFERQARHQTSSLEDLESKYSMAVERGVLLEEDIRQGEQERETLRIDNQHLREELSDIKVELEIVQGKLRHAESTVEEFRNRRPTPVVEIASARPKSPDSEASHVSRTTESTAASASAMSSPLVTTPPPLKSDASTLETSPSSPPASTESKANRVAVAQKKKLAPITPVPSKIRNGLPTTTPRLSAIRPPNMAASTSRHSRVPSQVPSGMTPARLPTTTPRAGGIPRRSLAGTDRHASTSTSNTLTQTQTSSRSLHQIRGLIGRMQKLEERVHTTRSKLPGPTSVPARASPRASPRSSADFPPSVSNVTVRSARKRTSNSTASGSVNGDILARSVGGRLSYGFNPAGPKTGSSVNDTPSRPSSRTSNFAAPSRSSALFARPSSRASVTSSSHHQTGRTTPLFGGDIHHRPRSSISGSYSATHGSQNGDPQRCVTPGPRSRTSNFSVSLQPGQTPTSLFSRSVSSAAMSNNSKYDDNETTPTALHTTGRKSGIPGPGLTGIPTPGRRQSGGAANIPGRRQSGASAAGENSRPPSSRGNQSALMGIGETF
jgi:hypothetical protein